eukprot:7669866-Lingulodinium_polyedra.AAC.1
MAPLRCDSMTIRRPTSRPFNGQPMAMQRPRRGQPMDIACQCDGHAMALQCPTQLSLQMPRDCH